MIDKILLGLLSKKDLTVYDIKIAMDKSISRFYSNSFGSLNPAMKKLEKQELIECTEVVEKSRLKKVYNITDLGKQEYSDWITEPIKQGRLKDEVLIRIFFLGDSDKEERERLVTDYLKLLETSRTDLSEVKEEIEANLPPEHKEKVKFQLSTLQFGIDYIAFKEKWFQNLLVEI